MRAVLITFTLSLAATTAGALAADSSWALSDETYALMVFDLGALAGERDVIPRTINAPVLDWPGGCSPSESDAAWSASPTCAVT